MSAFNAYAHFVSMPFMIAPCDNTRGEPSAVAYVAFSDDYGLLINGNRMAQGEEDFVHYGQDTDQNLDRHKTRIRPEVIASLERSLKEYADVWAELSKY